MFAKLLYNLAHYTKVNGALGLSTLKVLVMTIDALGHFETE